MPIRSSRLIKKTTGIFLISLLVGLAFPISAYANINNADWCEQQWVKVSSKFGEGGDADLLPLWKKYEPQCAGTVSYEARLSIVYVLLGRTDKARELLTPLVNTSSTYKHLVEFSLLQADAADLTLGGIKVEDVRLLEKKYDIFVKKYPKFLDGYAALGGLQTTLGMHEKAIKSLEIGLRSPMDISGVYRNLTISYSEVGRFKDALLAADKAHELNGEVMSDPYFLLSFARAKAGVNDCEYAVKILKLVSAKFPGIQNSPEFNKTADFINTKAR